jgi:hypothetical protein
MNAETAMKPSRNTSLIFGQQMSREAYFVALKREKVSRAEVFRD